MRKWGWRLVPEKPVPPPKPEPERKRAPVTPKPKTPTLHSPASYGLPGNPHDQFVKDLIAGLSDGSIVLRSVNVQRRLGAPDLEMTVELIQLDPTKPTVPQKLHQGPMSGALGPTGVTGAVTPQYFAASVASMTSVVATNPMIQAVTNLPGAKSYGPGGKGLPLKTGTEPIVGYRDFSLIQGAYGLHLKSRNNAIWPPRKKMYALCNGNPFVSHDAPSLDCDCGIYAYDSPDNPSLRADSSALWGEVLLWGEVVVCDSGYRAQYAYPSYLFLRTSQNSKATSTLELVRDELEDTYGVPVMIVSQRSGKTSGELMEEALNALLKEEA